MTNVISFISIKGGAGKTTSVVNLGYVLAKHFNKRVLLVDGNFSSPNLIFHLGLSDPPIGINEMIVNRLDPFKAIYTTQYGFHVLPAKLNNQKGVQVSLLRNYIDKLRHHYDFILIDSSPNVSAEITAAIDASGRVIVVLNPDFPGLSCAMHAIQIAKQLNHEVIGLIINMSFKSKNELDLNQIEDATGEKVLAKINFNRDIHEAVLKTEPLAINLKKDYIKEYIELAKYLILCEDPENKDKEYKLKKSAKNIPAKNRISLLENCLKEEL